MELDHSAMMQFVSCNVHVFPVLREFIPCVDNSLAKENKKCFLMSKFGRSFRIFRLCSP